jgi:kynureninase
MAQGLLALLRGRYEMRLADFDEIAEAIDNTVAVALVTHVNYRTGAMHDLAAITRRARDAGALMIWDLAHSAGAVPVRLNDCGADFAVGCGYKYLNGGPGAPAFVYAAERHLQALADDPFAQPLSGWLGHRSPFTFESGYAPAASIERFGVGTPPIIALAALEIGVETVLAAGVEALRAKSVALTDLFVQRVEERCAGHGLMLVSPRDSRRRGSQVCFAHDHAWPIVQALIARDVIGDFRAPDILRFGMAPLYLRYVDIWDAVESLREVLLTRAWDRPEFTATRSVT